MPRKTYTNIAVPVDLAEAIDKAIKDSSLGFTSRAQFAIEAIRTYLLKVKKK